jgi:branched-chain amino acid transport system ATP-binding protein
MTATDATTTAPAGRGLGNWLRARTGGAPLYPLVILTGLLAVDELDRAAFAILLPEIKKAFDLNLSAVLAVVALASLVALLIQVPIAFWSDRLPRTKIALLGAVVWMAFTGLTGAAMSVLVLSIARAGSGLGKAVVDPTHGSLLSDYYDIPYRPRVFSIHRAGSVIGLTIGPLAAGLIAYWTNWRVPFFVFMVPTLVFVLLGLRLKEPKRGVWEKRAAGAEEDAVETEDLPPSFAESWRIVWQVGTLRRIFYALPFLAVALIGLASLTSLHYSQTFGLDERARGIVAACIEPAALIGLFVGIPIATRLLQRDPGLVLKFIALVNAIVAVLWIGFALAPNIWVAVTIAALTIALISITTPGIGASLSLATPPKVRSFGYAVAALWILPGLVVLPIIGQIADHHGVRVGLLVLTPVFLIGSFILASAGTQVADDLKQVWTSAAAQSEVLYQRRQGLVKLLLVRGLDVGYDGVQVLFGVDFEVDEGEIVALLGTNGSGKSTLLKAISGLVEASAGAVVFDGRDMTYAPPHEVAARGITQVPGGQGTFPTLTVRENLQLAGWLHRRERDRVRAATEEVLDLFPILRERLDEPAGNLSGGQQQMLTLGMAFIERPRLLMIDELSLGLAPAVVGQLLEIVQRIRDAGTTIIVVEQSVNVALTIAERAYFLEKGEIRFEGPTAELLERPDVLRSVYLEGAASRGAALAAAREHDTEVGHEAEARPVRLEVRDVSKRFGGIHALRDVSFDAHAGEILGFIGPNGAGKTTLFDAICGFTPTDGGRVVLLGDEGPVELTGKRAEIRAQLGLGRSFQDGRLFPGLTVAETIAVALEGRVEVRDPIAAALHLPAVADSEAEVADRVDELIELMGLGAFRDKFTRELSTGSRRIVDMACVLAHQPKVLLLDEPSSGIAQREAEALGPLLLRIRDALDATILIIEHDLPLLTSVADRLVALDLGAVVTIGDPAEVVRHPTVVESYLGTSEAAIARSGSSGAPTT